jgi:hypothetical protein
MKRSNSIEIYINGLNILDLNEQSEIYGGEVVLSNSEAASIGHGAGQALQNISDSWNSFWSGFNQGYKDHIK